MFNYAAHFAIVYANLHAGNREVNWKKVIKKPPQQQAYKRFIYPTIWERHFTVVVLDLPVTGRVGRAVFLDPMQEYHPHITNAFSSWFKFRNWLDMSHIHVHGGIQKDNVTVIDL